MHLRDNGTVRDAREGARTDLGSGWPEAPAGHTGTAAHAQVKSA
jgi:hypothetical protein